MVDIEYANAYSEVLEILKFISEEDYNKIPKNKINLFIENANKDYVFNYNPSKTLEEQGVSKISRGIIAILFRDYWANEVQKNKIIAKQNYDRMKLEEEKRKKYNINIFDEENSKTKQNRNENIATNQVVIAKNNNESVFRKIINKIKKLIYRKR